LERADDASVQAYPMMWQRDVRFYVSTLCYHGSVLLHDGLDDALHVGLASVPGDSRDGCLSTKGV